jgi:site-specific DNA-methyltransferase (adenine-specific)
MNTVVFGDNLAALRALPDSFARLIYVDPPFNTGKKQERKTLRTTAAVTGDRTGFKGNRYSTEHLGTKEYDDNFDDYLGFLMPRLEEAKRLLTPDGSLFVHLDCREVHYVKIALDGLFGRSCFLNEIIWSYDYGARSRKKWSTKHDNILVYVNDPDNYVFNYDAIDRIPYMAPKLVGEEKAAIGKTPTDVWWNTIVSPTGKEKTGYPTQKPIRILERIVDVHSHPNDMVLDFFAGSGTTGEAAAKLGRQFYLVDSNPQSIEVMQNRLNAYNPQFIEV